MKYHYKYHAKLKYPYKYNTKLKAFKIFQQDSISNFTSYVQGLLPCMAEYSLQYA